MFLLNRKYLKIFSLHQFKEKVYLSSGNGTLVERERKGSLCPFMILALFLIKPVL